MIQKATVSPINSLLFIADVDGGKPPEPVWGQKIHSTPSCISFACFPEIDGPTEVTIGPAADVVPGPFLVFDGLLETPQRKVIVDTVDRQVVLIADVAKARTAVRIWYSHPEWPEKVTIGLT